MVKQHALRPHAIAGVALALGASLIALTPATAPSPAVPHVDLPAIQLTSNDALHAGQTPDQVAGSQTFAHVDITGMIDADVHWS